MPTSRDDWNICYSTHVQLWDALGNDFTMGNDTIPSRLSSGTLGYLSIPPDPTHEYSSTTYPDVWPKPLNRRKFNRRMFDPNKNVWPKVLWTETRLDQKINICQLQDIYKVQMSLPVAPVHRTLLKGFFRLNVLSDKRPRVKSPLGRTSFRSNVH